jgi:hypothetical protein
MVERITSEIGRSFMVGVQALRPSIAGAACQGSQYRMDVMSEDLEGKLYSENNVATLKGCCGVVDVRDIPVIWDAFQHTKEIALHQHNLRVTMEKWAKNTGLNINKAPFFNK